MPIIYLLPEADTTVYQLLPCQNFALRSRMLAGHDADGSESYMLIRFALDTILPPGSTVIDASMLLFFTYTQRTSDQTEYGVHRILSEWSPTRVNWFTRPLYEQTPALTFSSPFPGSLRLDVTELVQAWQTGGAANLGLLIRGLGSLPRGNFIRAATINATDSDSWPRLRIDYLLPTPVVAPEFVNLQDILEVPAGGSAEEVQDVSLWRLATVSVSNQGPDAVEAHLEISADGSNYVQTGATRTVQSGETVNLVADIFARYLKVVVTDVGGNGATVEVYYQGQIG